MIQKGNERGYQGPQQQAPVGLSGHPGADQGGTNVEWEWTKDIHGPQKYGLREFSGDNVVDQEDSGATMWWTRMIRSRQTRS